MRVSCSSCDFEAEAAEADRATAVLALWPSGSVSILTDDGPGSLVPLSTEERKELSSAVRAAIRREFERRISDREGEVSPEKPKQPSTRPQPAPSTATNMAERDKLAAEFLRTPTPGQDLTKSLFPLNDSDDGPAGDD